MEYGEIWSMFLGFCCRVILDGDGLGEKYFSGNVVGHTRDYMYVNGMCPE